MFMMTGIRHGAAVPYTINDERIHPRDVPYCGEMSELTVEDRTGCSGQVAPRQATAISESKILRIKLWMVLVPKFEST